MHFLIAALTETHLSTRSLRISHIAVVVFFFISLWHFVLEFVKICNDCCSFLCGIYLFFLFAVLWASIFSPRPNRQRSALEALTHRSKFEMQLAASDEQSRSEPAIFHFHAGRIGGGTCGGERCTERSPPLHMHFFVLLFLVFCSFELFLLFSFSV